MKATNYILLAAIAGMIIHSCKPFTEEGIDLPNPPSASFNWSFLDGDENRVVFESTSADGFIHFWDFGNGQTSNALVDTIFYPQAGAYEVTYSISNAGGMGSSEQTVNIAQTVELPCDGTLELLTGCDNQKSWVFAQDEAAIGVGPDPYSISWYTSPAAGLVPEQYDDVYQFTADGGFVYDNAGGTINPWEGYVSQPLDVPELTYQLLPGAGTSGEDQIILPACWFMGTWDSGPVYDIVELTDTRLVIHGAIQDGSCQTAEGYFTFIFDAQ